MEGGGGRGVLHLSLQTSIICDVPGDFQALTSEVPPGKKKFEKNSVWRK